MTKKTDTLQNLDVIPTKTIPEFSAGCRTRIEFLFEGASPESLIGQTRKVCAWSKTTRKQGKALIFYAVTDGSCNKTLQVVVSPEGVNGDEEFFTKLGKCGTSTSFEFVGDIVKSPAEGQSIELHINDSSKHSVKIFGGVDNAKFPLAKKQHTMEFLRDIPHLRTRSYLQGAVLRIRHEMALATHQFFQNRGFKYIHTPLITENDCEGAGELFSVTTTIPDNGKAKEIPTKNDKVRKNF